MDTGDANAASLAMSCMAPFIGVFRGEFAEKQFSAVFNCAWGTNKESAEFTWNTVPWEGSGFRSVDVVGKVFVDAWHGEQRVVWHLTFSGDSEGLRKVDMPLMSVSDDGKRYSFVMHGDTPKGALYEEVVWVLQPDGSWLHDIVVKKIGGVDQEVESFVLHKQQA